MIIVSEAIMGEILSEAGYPTISITDLELKTYENLKSTIIWPAMREFFKWFPIVESKEYQVSSTFEIDFPSLEVFTVTGSRMNTAGFIARDASNPFVNNSIYRSVNTYNVYGGGTYGTMNDYDMRTARMFERMERQSTIEMNKAVKMDVDLLNRKVTGFCNVTGRLIIDFGKWSEDFNRVPFQFQEHVIKLARAYLLRHLGMLRGQQVSTLPNNFNFQMYLDRADKLEDEVINRFKKYTKVALGRG